MTTISKNWTKFNLVCIMYEGHGWVDMACRAFRRNLVVKEDYWFCDSIDFRAAIIFSFPQRSNQNPLLHLHIGNSQWLSLAVKPDTVPTLTYSRILIIWLLLYCGEGHSKIPVICDFFVAGEHKWINLLLLKLLRLNYLCHWILMLCV